MKKMIRKPYLAIFIFLFGMFFFFSCKKNSVEPFDPEVDFKLRLLNLKGEEATSFKEGEKFWLSFLIINKIDSTRFFYPDRLVDNKTLFRVITSDSTKDFGQPYETIVCTGQKMSIQARQSLELKVPWHTDSVVRNSGFCLQSIKKDVLPKGFYKTVLQEFLVVSTLEGNRLTKKTNLSVTFEIK